LQAGGHANGIDSDPGLPAAVARLNPFPLLGALWQIFVALKGTIVDVDDPHYSVSVQIS